MIKIFKFAPIIAVAKVLFLALWLIINGRDADMPETAYAETPKTQEKAVKPKKKEEAGKAETPRSIKSEQPDTKIKESELLAAIEKRQKELDKREDDLRAQDERLKALKTEIEARMDELNKIKSEAEKSLRTIEKVNREEFMHIIKIYEAMPAEEAAARLSKLDNELAVKLLSNMKGKTAGKILSFVEPAKAAELTQGLGKTKAVH